MTRRFKNLTESDIAAIVLEINKWALGEFEGKLTWAVLERSTGYSRQALQCKAAIKGAYRNAKSARRKRNFSTVEQAAEETDRLTVEIGRLENEIKELERRQELWRLRWQKIAFNIRQKGLQMAEIDTDVADGIQLPSEKQTESILKPYEKDIPSSGRV